MKWSLSSWTLASIGCCILGTVPKAQAQPFNNCGGTNYYSSLPASLDEWSRDAIHKHIQTTHQGQVIQSNTPRGSDDVWGALTDLDPGTAGPTVRLIYSNEDVAKVPFAGTDWNKEWIWPRARGVGLTGIDAVDLHNIRPIEPNPTQMVKADKYFGECGILEHGGQCQTPAEGTNNDASSCSCNRAYEPPDNVKGVVARTLMYMDLRYDGDEPDTANLRLTDCPFQPPNDMAYKSQLLAWHTQFPPTQDELDRNQKVCESYQGNRNPFVDHPTLASKIYGDPLSDPAAGLENYEACAEFPTMSPTLVPNDCEMLTEGSLAFFLVNSFDPDGVAIFPFEELPPNLELFMTDNAWNGLEFENDEGIEKFTASSKGEAAGRWFGYGTGMYRGDEWETVEGTFSLSQEGDQIFLYCMGASNNIHFLSSLSYNAKYSSPGLPKYGLNESALPLSLLEYGSSIELISESGDTRFGQNWNYDGPSGIEIDKLRVAMWNASNWKGSDLPYSMPVPPPKDSSPSQAIGTAMVFVMGLSSFLFWNVM